MIGLSFRLTRSAHVLGSVLSSAKKNNLQITNFSQTFYCSQISNHNLKEAKMPGYEMIEVGAKNSTDYSIYYKNACGNLISPLHDIPLYANEQNNIYNMVVEIPRWTNAKFEISMNTPLNPIKQDIKKNKLRYVANCFPHKGYIWNYGALPQTWENPNHIEPSTGCKGDNDPIDVLEIGYRVAKRGEILKVKILGAVALIDEGETDWKIIVIDTKDPIANELKDVSDIDKFFPGLLRATVEWFKIYKIPDGKPENQFAFNGDAKNAQSAECIVEETHKFWQGLISQSLEGGEISCLNTTIKESPYVALQDQAAKALEEAPNSAKPEEEDDAGDRWHFIYLKNSVGSSFASM